MGGWKYRVTVYVTMYLVVGVYGTLTKVIVIQPHVQVLYIQHNTFRRRLFGYAAQFLSHVKLR
jgi:hypothetical protein